VKKLLRSDAAQRVLAALIALYLRLAYRLSRWTRVNEAVVKRHIDSGQPVIMAFWHGRMLPLLNFWPYRMPMYLLSSPHRDGLLMVRTVRHFGVRNIIGSTTRGGTRAFREMVKVVRDGNAMSVTPDGPRGPRMRATLGIVFLAKLTGAPIIPVTYSTTAAWAFGSWDRLLLPKPFGRAVVIFGEPITVSGDADHDAIEVARAALEASLNDMTAEADRRCGRVPTEPAPLDAAAKMAETAS